MTLRERLKTALDVYDQALDNRQSESEIGRLFSEAEGLVPNARLSELYFYPDRERSHEEIAGEAVYREELWQRGGDIAVLLHVRLQLEAALTDPNANGTTEVVCGQALDGVKEELAELGYQDDALN